MMLARDANLADPIGPNQRKVQIHSAPSLLVELGSDVAARGEPPRFTPSCCKSHDVACC